MESSSTKWRAIKLFTETNIGIMSAALFWNQLMSDLWKKLYYECFYLFLIEVLENFLNLYWKLFLNRVSLGIFNEWTHL